MPGLAAHCLNTIQPIIGADMHKTVPPPIPVPPFAPHIIVWFTGLSEKMSLPLTKFNSKAERGAGANTSCGPNPVQCGYGYAVGRQHDAGPWVVHIWPNFLLPLILLGAGNKSEFGSKSVQLHSGPMAVACIPIIGINPQLDCQDFPIPPLPSSNAIASLNTVYAGFTWADFFGGLLSMIIDSAVTWAVNGIVSFATQGLGNALGKVAGNGVQKAISDACKVAGADAPNLAAMSFKDFASYWTSASNVAPAVLGWLAGTQVFGTPLGYSNPNAPVGKTAGQASGN
jgi:hypothetical protein